MNRPVLAVIEIHHLRVYPVNFFQNGFVLQLTPPDQTQLQQICKPVELQSGQILSASGDDADAHVYFLTGATVALLVQGPQNATVAVGLLGAEDVVGIASALASSSEHLRFEVQSAGTAWCAPRAAVRQMMSSHPPMLWLVSKYLWQLVEHIAQVTAEIQTHDIRRRLATWLLLSANKAQSPTLHLTHKHLARMLGVRRVSITLAAGELRDMGLLTYGRGHVHLVDQAGLERLLQPG